MAKLSEENGQFNIKINIDTEDAVRSLKTLQRTARVTAKELRELESFKEDASPIQLMDCDMEEPAYLALKRFTTKELTEELVKREGISVLEADLGDDIYIDMREKNGLGHGGKFNGPAIVLVNQD